MYVEYGNKQPGIDLPNHLIPPHLNLGRLQICGWKVPTENLFAPNIQCPQCSPHSALDLTTIHKGWSVPEKRNILSVHLHSSSSTPSTPFLVKSLIILARSPGPILSDLTYLHIYLIRI